MTAHVQVSDFGRASKSALATDKDIEHVTIGAMDAWLYIMAHTRYVLTVVKVPSDDIVSTMQSLPVTRESLAAATEFLKPGTRRPAMSVFIEENGILLKRTDTGDTHLLRVATDAVEMVNVIRPQSLQGPIDWHSPGNGGTRFAIAPGHIRTLNSIAWKSTDPIIVEPGPSPSDPILFRIGSYALVYMSGMYGDVENLSANTQKEREQWNDAFDALMLTRKA